MRTITPLTLLVAISIAGCTAETPSGPEAPDPAAGAAGTYPDVITLPDGFWPEGITFGRGSTFYVTSLATGAIYRADARTGAGDILVTAQPGREAVGLKYDERNHRLVVAGGFTGEAHVLDAATGATLASYRLADPEEGLTLVNDVTLTRDAAYFTDSYRTVLYRIPLPANGAFAQESDVQTIPLSSEFEFDPATPIGNANGIAATPDGRYLMIVSTATGTVYRVDARTGDATAVTPGGISVSGDGLLLVGRRLYVVDGVFDRIVVVRLDADYDDGVVERVLTDPDLQFPSTIARFGNALYAVNARFDVVPGPEVQYQVVRVDIAQ